MSDTINEFSTRHPHEPGIPPAIDNDGRCLVCVMLVELTTLCEQLAVVDEKRRAWLSVWANARERITKLEGERDDILRELNAAGQFLVESTAPQHVDATDRRIMDLAKQIVAERDDARRERDELRETITAFVAANNTISQVGFVDSLHRDIRKESERAAKLAVELEDVRRELAECRKGNAACVDDNGIPFASARIWRDEAARLQRELADERSKREAATQYLSDLVRLKQIDSDEASRFISDPDD